MGSNGKDEVMMSNIDAAECSDATVEIKIKTLDSQTYTLRVDKCVPVPALKEQIAIVTGVLSEQQRLICRGKVLMDDQLLSAYHVEDGHTLHLVVRQPIPPSESLPDNPAANPAASPGHSQGSHQGTSVLLGTFNISEQGDAAFADLNRLVSAVLSSIGISAGSGSEGVDLRESATGWLPRTPGLSGLREASRQHIDQAVSMGQSNPFNGTYPSIPTAAPLVPQQPLVILDSLTTLSQYLSRLRHEFSGSVGGNTNNSQASGTRSNNVQEGEAVSRGQGGLPTPATLAEVMLSTRQILIEQAAECLSQLTSQLENHANVTDSLARIGIQSNAMRSGVLLQYLGALLLELGRTTMTLRMGQTPADAVVNTGPAVFISTSGPNPIMVQPLPFQPGTSFGAIPMGALQPGPGSSGGTPGGSAFMPRNIDIRIRTGSLVSASTANQREPTGVPQPPAEANPAVSEGGIHVHHAAAGSSVSLSSTREAEVRVVPIRTVVAAVPAHVRRVLSDSSRGSVGLIYPILERVQNVASGNSNSARGSPASDDRHQSGLDSEQQPNLESAGEQQNTPLSGTGRDGDGVQNNRGFPNLHNRLDQFIRTIFPEEEVHFGGDFNFQGPATSSVTHNVQTTEAAANTQEAASRVVDEGTFFSNMLRQVMPYISQSTASESNLSPSERTDVLGNSNRQASSTQENSNVGNSSRRQADPPSSPNSKRQKRE